MASNVPGFSVPVEIMDNLCDYYGKSLVLPIGLDGVALFKAIADVESSYGTMALPRHEKAYDWGGRYATPNLLRQYGSWAAHSYGPFQVMYPTIREMGLDVTPLAAAQDATVSAGAACRLINKRLIKQIPTGCTIDVAIRTIGDGYNSGTAMDSVVPERYIEKLQSAYQARLDERRHIK